VSSNAGGVQGSATAPQAPGIASPAFPRLGAPGAPDPASGRSIAAGHSDGYLTRVAKAVRALNLPVAISSGHEMNGNWYVLGFVWFDYNKQGVDWRVESRPVVRAAIAGDVAGLSLVNPRK
jgi:hypothetical protein